MGRDSRSDWDSVNNSGFVFGGGDDWGEVGGGRTRVLEDTKGGDSSASKAGISGGNIGRGDEGRTLSGKMLVRQRESLDS